MRHSDERKRDMDPIQNLPNPLNIPRPDLIKALQAKADAEAAKRKDSQDVLDASRKAAVDAINMFSPEELYEIFRDHYTVDAEFLTKCKTEKLWVPPQVQPSCTETALERAVRVLTLASDETVQVKPDSDLYRLL